MTCGGGRKLAHVGGRRRFWAVGQRRPAEPAEVVVGLVEEARRTRICHASGGSGSSSTTLHVKCPASPTPDQEHRASKSKDFVVEVHNLNVYTRSAGTRAMKPPEAP